MGGANSSGLTSELYRYHAMDNTWVTLHVILPRPVISPYYINIPDTNLLLLIGGMERNG